MDEEVDYPGVDIAVKKGVKSWQACREHCNKNKDCSFFTWVSRMKDCWIKKAMSNKIQKSGHVSGSSCIEG